MKETWGKVCILVLMGMCRVSLTHTSDSRQALCILVVMTSSKREGERGEEEKNIYLIYNL